jgi:hypothetical protein
LIAMKHSCGDGNGKDRYFSGFPHPL